MRKSIAFAAATLFAFGAVAAGPASQADIDHTVELTVGEIASVAGGVAQGFNLTPTLTAASGGIECSKSPDTYCEKVLITVTNPFEEENAKKGRERANLSVALTPTVAAADFDLYLFEADADGNEGAEVGASDGTPLVSDPDSIERVNMVVSTTAESTTTSYIAWVVYFAAPSDYTMDVSFTQ